MSAEARSHYGINEVKSMAEIREVFPLGEADELNWFFASTSGVHGDYTSLEDLESWIRQGLDREDDYCLTVLIVQPRLVKVRYGQIKVGAEDFTFLRGLVRSTLAAVAKSQAGNL